MYNAAPTPHTDIRGTLSCLHAVRTACATVSCAHANIVLEKVIDAGSVIHPSRFKLQSKKLLRVTLFGGGIGSDASVAAKSLLSMSAALSFASAFPRAVEVGLFLGVVASLSRFRGGEINAQSEPVDKGSPVSLAAGVASAGSVVERTTFVCRPSSLKSACGGVRSLATSLLLLPPCARL